MAALSIYRPPAGDSLKKEKPRTPAFYAAMLGCDLQEQRFMIS
jgi:hypothetical protein